MPLHDYECITCGHTFEEIRKATESNPECPECRGETRKQISRSSFRLKGGGWGDTGYSKEREND